MVYSGNCPTSGVSMATHVPRLPLALGEPSETLLIFYLLFLVQQHPDNSGVLVSGFVDLCTGDFFFRSVGIEDAAGAE